MPNWAFNHLRIAGKPSDVKRMMAEVSSTCDGEPILFDFDKVKPIDKNAYRVKTWRGKDDYYYNDSHSSVEWVEKVFDSTEVNDKGDTFAGWSFNWYSAQIAEWGTKWNAGDVSVETLDEDDDSMTVEYTFDTAWSAPIPVIEEFCRKYPELYVEYYCTEESVVFLLCGHSDEGDKEFILNSIEPDQYYGDDRKYEVIREELSAMGVDPDTYDVEKIVDNGVLWYNLDYDDGYSNFDGIHLSVAEFGLDEIEDYKK